ncbi:hypothetical protein BKA70DRAFT_1427390 [Coprinopsis sp. MPI-PUGE-AT-0042]|nr:hypothetical protein BKA70DRAFT_1427390 [Coprinopsis sp. MPI-PUGE-AT-0042]
MPAPAVYILAAFAVVGTAIIVKEFVYNPHIAPLIEEYKETRRRRRHGPVSVPQHPHSSDTSDDERSPPPSHRGFAGDWNDSDSEHYGQSHPHSGTHGGLDIELEDLVAREIREWGSPDRSATSGSNTNGLRLRRRPAQGERNALDEDNQHLSFAPISPTRPTNSNTRSVSPASSSQVSPAQYLSSLGQATHVIHGSASDGRVTTPSPTRTASLLFTHSGFDSPPRVPQSSSGPSSPSPRRFSPAEVAKDLPPLPGSPATKAEIHEFAPTYPTLRPLAIPVRQRSTSSEEGFADSVASSATSARTVRPPISFLSQLEEQPDVRESNFTRPSLPRLPSSSSERTFDDFSSPVSQRAAISPIASPTASTSPQLIPSLSQSYPQELDYEHNVVLLSPPSSRSESPFSVLGNGEGVGSPFVGFGALGESPNKARNDASDKSTPVSSAPHSPSESPASQYISMPGSNRSSVPGSPTPAQGRSGVASANPFVDPGTPRTPTTALDIDSDLSDWEHAGSVNSPSPPRPVSGAVSSPERGAAGFGSDDDDDVFSDSGLSEASLSSWASVSGRSSNGA